MLRSKGKVSGARLAMVTSEVVHPGGKKAAGAWRGRGEAAKAGRRPLHDELGGHWQQVPGQTDTSEGMEGLGERMNIMRGLVLQRSQFRGRAALVGIETSI